MVKTLHPLLIFSFITLLSGCASFGDSPRRVKLQNPTTLEFVDCDVDKWGTAASYERNNKCVEDYQNQGYIIWGKY